MNLSVLISVYKKENSAYLEQALQSIWDDQIQNPDEIVLVKDGSLTVKLDSVIDRWQEKLSDKLKVIELSKNVGLGHALNIGLQHCSNELVARMDADDIAMSHRFEQQIDFMEQNPHIDILSSWAIEINEQGIQLRMREVPETHEEIVNLLWAIPVIHPAVTFRKSAILESGSYSMELKRRQDYELWFRCAKNGCKFANIQEPLIYYRFSDNFFKKNGLNVALQQLKVGFNGCRMINAPLKAYVGITVPFVRALLPNKLNKHFQKIINKFDPRKQSK
jgi:glycosyltransferase involved in cell wall biosynthesis